jgi:ectoine hydroxylase-related dioxygenase (phytanoyl-CoA dioxygenase family)
VEKYRSAIQKITHINFGDQKDEQIQYQSQDLYNYPETWGYIVNDRLLSILRDLLGPNIYYLHNSEASQYSARTNAYRLSWHRDSPCRRSGRGPDWDDDLPYNVVTAITYLESDTETDSGVTVIPASHKKSYAHTFSNLLRVFHFKTKNIKLLKGMRKKIQNYIGVNCRTDPGDCAIFFTNLLHAPLPTKGLRRAIFARYGADGKHSKNYVNWYLKHRKGYDYEINDNNKVKVEDFFNLLRSKSIFYPVPEKKEEIKDAPVPTSER